MLITETPIPDLKVITPRIFEDKRGYFFESYNKKKYQEAGIDIPFVQDNQSRSVYGVIRGLHFQMNPKAQTKLVRVLEGKIYDVAVDIRMGSPTYGKWYGIELSAENKKLLLIPKGFAHGFSVLGDNATVMYKCDEFYAPDVDSGIRFDSKILNINWLVPSDKIIVSEKDLELPDFSSMNNNFTY